MPVFSVALTDSRISMKSINTKRELNEKVENIPIEVFLQLKKKVSISRLKKPVCSSRLLEIPIDSEIYSWFDKYSHNLV